MSIESAITALSAMLGERVSRSKPDLARHDGNVAELAFSSIEAVAHPRTTAEVAAIMRICAEERCPIFPGRHGRPVAMATQTAPRGIRVDFTQMSRILAIRPADMEVTVQAGVTLAALNEELRAIGLFFAVDPGCDATLGALAASGSGSVTAPRYGTMRDNVLGLEAVTAAGELIRTDIRAPAACPAYDLTALLLGSHGTLGLITEITLRLHARPERISGALCAFPNLSSAMGAAIDVMQAEVPPARIDLLDQHSLSALNGHSGSARRHGPHLLLEFHGSETSVADEAEHFAEIAQAHDGTEPDWALERAKLETFQALRQEARAAIEQSRPGARMVVTDLAVPLSALAEAIETTREDITDLRLHGATLGNPSEAGLRVILMIDESDAGEVARAATAQARLAERAMALGGACKTGHEHGAGRRRAHEPEAEASEAMMAAIKLALDPDNLLNPGKLVPLRPAGES